MSHRLVFDILPFDPMILPNPQISLPIDFDDFAAQLQAIIPDSEIRIKKKQEEIYIDLFITHEKVGRWFIAGFDDVYDVLYVAGWPKCIAKALILWYRSYISSSYPLFLVIPEYGFVAEITVDTSAEDIENMYPYPVPED